MSRKLLVIWLCLLLVIPFIATAEQPVTVLKTPVQVVTAFQKFETFEMYCTGELWGNMKLMKIGEKFQTYLTKDFYNVFLWSQCYEPENPPSNANSVRELFWDIRFGTSGGTSPNYRVRPAKQTVSDQATVIVLFDIGPEKNQKNIKVTYTLIREEGKWKIDDIAPEGDESSDYGERPILERSLSIKSDMQNHYNAALARYQKEQAAKGATPKP